MADEHKQDETTDTPEEAPVEGAPGDEAAAEETPEAPVEEAPADDAPEPEEAAPAAAAPPPEAETPVEALAPKARRKAERSRHSGEAAPPRSDEQRAADRAGARQAKARARQRARASARNRRGDERGEGTPPRDRVGAARKVRQGTVVSAKPDKTITVRVEIARRHPVYEKVVRRSGTVHAHDERNEAHEGDIVRVVESRPLSKLKRWRLLEIVERAR